MRANEVKFFLTIEKNLKESFTIKRNKKMSNAPISKCRGIIQTLRILVKIYSSKVLLLSGKSTFEIKVYQHISEKDEF